MAKVYNGASDFVLFPREQPFFDAFEPQLGDYSNLQYNSSGVGNMQQDREFHGHAGAPYESYSQFAYSSVAPGCFAAHNAPFAAPKSGQSLQRHNPSGPPSPSTSHTFENASSNMSSASGASGQSTASSADGSPYANPQHSLPYQEKWEPLGLGLGPEIVNTEVINNTCYQSTNFDTEFLLDDSKFAHCVGEYEKNFSQSFPTSHSVSSSMSSGSALQSHLPALCSSPLVLDTKLDQRDVTIDSILEEANNQIQNPTHLASPVSFSFGPSTPRFHYSRIVKDEHPISPVSSASATTSPTIVPGKHRSATPVGRRQSFKSPVFSGCTYGPQQSPSQLHLSGPPAQTPTSPSQKPNTQNSFFCQSSGRFVAPLESSCWFS